MIHCKVCKHWSPPGSVRHNYASKTHGTCELITSNQHLEDEDPANLAQSADMEGVGALLTRPEFGCVLGRGKGDNT